MNAREWLASGRGSAQLTVLGAPISRASISPSNAWATPSAVRDALARFPTWDAQHGIDLAALRAVDAGDVIGDRDDADAARAHVRIHDAVLSLTAEEPQTVVAVIGGDNSLTRPAMQAMMEARPGTWGLVTLDAHHDCRPLDPGPRNGTPVRELIDAGLPGSLVAQVGIHPHGNAREHAEWALNQGIRVYPAPVVRERGAGPVLHEALAALAAAGATHLYADIDVDVVDRAFAPACPASLPGGLLPADLLEAAFLLGAQPRVEAMDLTEVDALADVNQVTVRLTAGALVAFCSGLASRTPAAPA